MDWRLKDWIQLLLMFFFSFFFSFYDNDGFNLYVTFKTHLLIGNQSSIVMEYLEESIIGWNQPLA